MTATALMPDSANVQAAAVRRQRQAEGHVAAELAEGVAQLQWDRRHEPLSDASTTATVSDALFET